MEPIINSLADDNSELLLSICIPTYNRANVLEECIKSIILQQGFDKRTEVIILDNSSTDNTKEIALSYTDLYPNILYFKNENNIGMEKNILEVLKYGKGKLLKLLNDYSLFTENKLENLLSVIISNKNEESILYFNNANNLFANVMCKDLDCFFRITTYWSTWIKTFSIWKKDLEYYKSTEKFEGLLFPHLLLTLDVFNRKKQLTIINGLFFNDIKGIQKGGYNFFEIFVQNFVGKIIHKSYNEKRINIKTLYLIKSTFINKFLKIWIINILYENTHNFNRKKFKLIFKYFILYPQLYGMLIYILFYPIFKLIKNMEFRIKQKFNLYELK